MKVTTAMLRAGVLALGLTALAAPAFAQATGGPSNVPTGSNQNLQADPGTANTGGTYAPGSSSGGMSGSGMSGTTGSGVGSAPVGRPGAPVGTGGPSNTPTGR